MKKPVLLATLLVLATFSVAAVNLTQVQDLGDKYNSQADSAPSFLKSLVGNQRISLHIDSANKSFGINMSKATVAGIQEGGFKNPTLEVTITEQNINTVSNSSNPLNTTSKMLKNGDITYKAHGFVNSVKFSILELFF